MHVLSTCSAGGRDVLVYRHPGLEPDSILKLRLVEPPTELLERVGPGYQHGLFFSTQGPSSPAAQLAGGDYDGDFFMLITNQQVYHRFRQCKSCPC